MRLQLTTAHPKATPGVPLFVSGGRAVSYKLGVILAQRLLRLSTAELAARLGVSRRTLEGWKIGRRPGVAALNVLRDLLEEQG